MSLDHEQIIKGHVRRMNNRRSEWECRRAAFEGRFWQHQTRWSHLVTDDSALPIKMQTNMLRPFVGSLVSNLFLQKPRFNAMLPKVSESKPGRPAKPKERADEVVARFADDWLGRSDLRAQANRAYSLALMYESAAFKLGFDHEAKGLEFSRRLWAQALPPWECLWDDRTTARERCRYMGHIRPESVEFIKETFDKSIPDHIEPRPLPDYVAGGWHQEMDEDSEEKGRDAGYVLLVEFYDLVDNKLLWFVASLRSNPDELTLASFHEDVLPYEHADGRPAVPIEPIVLDPLPEFPLQGMSVVDGLYEINAERNLLLSYLASAFRRDAARTVLYRKDSGIDEEVLGELMKGNDLALVGVQTSSLENLFKEFGLPPLPASLDKYAQYLDLARQESKGVADLTQGRQGKYLSATEAGLLAKYSESTTGQVALRMDEALNRTGELLLAIAREELNDTSLRVHLGEDEYGNLSKSTLDWPWRLELEDSSVAPAKEAERKQEWQGVHASLISWVTVAAAAPQTDPETGAPLPPTPEPVKRMAIEAIEYTVQLYDLPEGMRWERLSAGAGVTEETPDPTEDAAALQAQQLMGATVMPPLDMPPPELGPVDPETGGLL